MLKRENPVRINPRARIHARPSQERGRPAARASSGNVVRRLMKSESPMSSTERLNRKLAKDAGVEEHKGMESTCRESGYTIPDILGIMKEGSTTDVLAVLGQLSKVTRRQEYQENLRQRGVVNAILDRGAAILGSAKDSSDQDSYDQLEPTVVRGLAKATVDALFAMSLVSSTKEHIRTDTEGIPFVVRVLELYIDGGLGSRDVALSCVRCLFSLSISRKNKAAIRKSSGIDVVVRVGRLYMKDCKVISMVMSTIANLSLDQVNQEALSLHGGIALVVDVIRSCKGYSDVSLATKALRAVWNLAENEENQLVMIEKHCILELLVGVMDRYPNQQELHRRANTGGIVKKAFQYTDKAYVDTAELNTEVIGALYNLSLSTSTLGLFREAGCIDRILRAMQQFPHSAELNRKAMLVLTNICVHQDNMAYFDSNGGIEMIAQTIDELYDREEVSNAALQITMQMTNYHGHHIREKGAFGALIRCVLRSEWSPSVTTRAFQVFYALCSDSADAIQNRKYIRDMGMIEISIKRLRKYVKEVDVNLTGAKMLCSVVKDPANVKVLLELGCVEVLRDMINQFTENVDVCRWALKAADTLTKPDENGETLTPPDLSATHKFVRVLLAHPDNTELAKLTFVVLANLSHSFEIKLRMAQQDEVFKHLLEYTQTRIRNTIELKEIGEFNHIINLIVGFNTTISLVATSLRLLRGLAVKENLTDEIIPPESTVKFVQWALQTMMQTQKKKEMIISGVNNILSFSVNNRKQFDAFGGSAVVKMLKQSSELSNFVTSAMSAMLSLSESDEVRRQVVVGTTMCRDILHVDISAQAVAEPVTGCLCQLTRSEELWEDMVAQGVLPVLGDAMDRHLSHSKYIAVHGSLAVCHLAQCPKLRPEIFRVDTIIKGLLGGLFLYKQDATAVLHTVTALRNITQTAEFCHKFNKNTMSLVLGAIEEHPTDIVINRTALDLIANLIHAPIHRESISSGSGDALRSFVWAVMNFYDDLECVKFGIDAILHASLNDRNRSLLVEANGASGSLFENLLNAWSCHSHDHKLQLILLAMLANLASRQSTHKAIADSGALDIVLNIMKEKPDCIETNGYGVDAIFNLTLSESLVDMMWEGTRIDTFVEAIRRHLHNRSFARSAYGALLHITQIDGDMRKMTGDLRTCIKRINQLISAHPEFQTDMTVANPKEFELTADQSPPPQPKEDTSSDTSSYSIGY